MPVLRRVPIGPTGGMTGRPGNIEVTMTLGVTHQVPATGVAVLRETRPWIRGCESRGRSKRWCSDLELEPPCRGFLDRGCEQPKQPVTWANAMLILAADGG